MIWMQTFNGTKWNLLAPRTADVDFAEISRSLSQIPRFLGHTKNFYSVAEHCCHVHDALNRAGYVEGVCLWGLLHDAHEAFTGDKTTPMKAALIALGAEATNDHTGGEVIRQALKELDKRHDAVIFEAAGLSRWMQSLGPSAVNAAGAQVKDADRQALIAERAALLGPSPAPWDAPYEGPPDPRIKIESWVPRRAYLEWMDRFRSLTAKAAA
jgi:uncharacterized protein